MTWRRADYGMNHGTQWARISEVSEDQIEQRVYRTGEKKWPRLTLTTWRYEDGVCISVDTKKRPVCSWLETNVIPPELVDDAIEMLTAAKAKVCKPAQPDVLEAMARLRKSLDDEGFHFDMDRFEKEREADACDFERFEKEQEAHK